MLWNLFYILILKLSNYFDTTKYNILFTKAELIKFNANRAKIEFIYNLETTGLADKNTLSNYLYNMWTSITFYTKNNHEVYKKINNAIAVSLIYVIYNI